MGIIYHNTLIQGSDEWRAARCGLLTASEMKHIVTPTLKVASNEKERTHLYELLSQRITGHVEPGYISDDMLRGQDEEIEARKLYAKHYAPVTECGMVTNDEWGFTIGYSPDALVGEDGLIECKSRCQKYQAQTAIESKMPDEYMIQIQTGLLVTRRKWCDFISYCGGMPMIRFRILPSDMTQAAIVEAATAFHLRLDGRRAEYDANIKALKGIPTVRTERKEMHL